MKAAELPKQRPAETIAATVGTVVGLLLALLHVYATWDVPPDLQPYVPIVIGWIAGAVTWWKVRHP